MCKYCIAILITLLSITNVIAQQKKVVRPFEYELSFGTTYGSDNYVGSRKIGPAISMEGRYNFNNSPYDIGLEIYFGSVIRSYQGDDLSNRIASISLYSDYNINRGCNVSYFLGAGIGIASFDVILGDYGDEGSGLVFSPRVGVELHRHIRITAYSKMAKDGYNSFGLSIGFVLGGGLKK